MNPSDPLDLLRQGHDLDARETPDCLDEDRLAALAEGSLDGSARAAAIRHVATCVRCRRVVASVARSLAEPGIAREIAAVEHPGRRRWLRVALPVAAAAILVVVALPRWLDNASSPHRGSPLPSAQTPRPFRPIGTVASARALQWAPPADPRADRYRVTLFDSAGRVLYETQLTDTMVSLPDSVGLSRGRTYLWLVEARIGWDRWAASDLVRFSINPPLRP